MGNISNIFYLKGSGDDWANAKCQLDECYKIPYLSGDIRYLQADIPPNYWVNEVWMCSMDGTRVQELLSITDWKTIYGDDINKLIFKIPEDSYACIGLPCIKCRASMNEHGNDPWYTWYMEGSNHVTVTLVDITNVMSPVLWDVTDINAPLPVGFERISMDSFYVPCDIDFANWNIQFVTTNNIGNHTQSWPTVLLEEEVQGCGEPLNCWYLEVPLLSSIDGEEVATLASEPFECPLCTPTVVIKGDYCLQPFDIYDQFIFDTTGLGNSQYGGLTMATNDMRIQAVLKKMPPTKSYSRNLKCNNFRSKLIPKWKLQGTLGFPDYMVDEIVSRIMGKKFYINGIEYICSADSDFTELNVQGYSMKRLDVELEQCCKSVVFDCSCVVPPVNCEDNPIQYDGILLVLQVPFVQYGKDNSIIDDTYVWTSIDPSGLSGGTPPYTISNWHTNSGHIIPNNDFEVFDDNREFNIWRRGSVPAHMGEITESVLVTITDANLCTKVLGNTVTEQDVRCAGFGAKFVVDNITDTTIDIINIVTEFGSGAFSCFDVSIDAITTGYQIIGITSLPYTITGLTANTEYQIVIRVWCECPIDPDNPMSETSGIIGSMYVTTLP